jgi:hypothetical protein
MARDLIPPPAPSWRPQPDGTPRFIELPPEPPVQTAEEEARAPRHLPPSPFRNRFGFLMGALGGILIAAVAVVVAVIATSGPSDEGLAKNWSTWKPEETSVTGGAADIATHIGPMYRLDNGQQIASVTGGPLQVQGFKLNVALRPSNGDIKLIGGTAVMYTLNGLGDDGAISSGAASMERHRLLRREALELALYSFRYLPGVKMVVTLLPPKALSAKDKAAIASGAEQQPPVQAVFYRPGDLKPELQVPLVNTVPTHTPRPDTIPNGESQKIDALTLNNLFSAQFTVAQDQQAYLVLQRATP